ncbi:TPA: hypothetical protein ACH3X1_007399 [Trebouxia sp. C0004]
MREPAPNQAHVPYQFTANEQIGPRNMCFRFHTVNHSVLDQVRGLQQEVRELRIEAAVLSEQLALIKSQVLLGEAIIVLDNIVADYVFGPYYDMGLRVDLEVERHSMSWLSTIEQWPPFLFLVGSGSECSIAPGGRYLGTG